MKLTISIESSGQLISVDVLESLALEDFKAYLQAETDIEPEHQVIFLAGKVVEGSGLLEELGIKDDDVILVVLKSAQVAAPAPEPVRAPSTHTDRAPPTHPDLANSVPPAVLSKIEASRQQVLNNPQIAEQFRESQPELHAALNNAELFRNLMLQQISQQQNQLSEEYQRLMANPEDPENQVKILEIIRQQQIDENHNLAYELIPESFTQVHMLYINISINGHSVQAFVDSGAQTTIISPKLAEKTGISRLIDKRFQGIAQGVGTQKIMGKIHSVPIKIGDSDIDIPCSFTVIDTSVDLLFGLDMLRRHKCVMDLVRDVLVVGGNIEARFLRESEIENNPFKAQNGGQTLGGSGSGLGGNLFSGNLIAPANVTPTPTSSAAEAATKRQGQSSEKSTEYSPNEKDISQLSDLGFSRQEAIKALVRTQGNVEMAAAYLFQ